MPRDYAARPYAEVRRRERAVDDDGWIAEFLHRAPMACLATVHDGQPFINSNLFVFDEPAHVIYMHGAPVGRTRANVEVEERVCFSVSEMGRLLPAPIAFNMSVEYAGVTVFGRASLIDDDAEKERVLQALVDKYFPHLRPDEHYGPTTPEERARTSVYRIEIDDWSGKRRIAEPDHPGAFEYPHPAA